MIARSLLLKSYNKPSAKDVPLRISKVKLRWFLGSLINRTNLRVNVISNPLQYLFHLRTKTIFAPYTNYGNLFRWQSSTTNWFQSIMSQNILLALLHNSIIINLYEQSDYSGTWRWIIMKIGKDNVIDDSICNDMNKRQFFFIKKINQLKVEYIFCVEI